MFKKLDTPQSKINEYFQYSPKRSLKPPVSISAFRSLVGNTFAPKTPLMHNLSHASELLHLIHASLSRTQFRYRTLKRFVVAIIFLLLCQKTPTFQQVQMETLVEKWNECLAAGYVVFEKSCSSRKVSMIVLVDVKCIDHS